MSVRTALYRYLTEPKDLPGLPAVTFERPRIIGDMEVNSRNDARRWLRSKIDPAGIYQGRRPQQHRKPTAIVLTSTTSSPEYGLAGAEEGTEEFVQATVACYGGDAAVRANNVAQLLMLAVGGWSGGNWGDTYVGECLVDGRSSRTVSPVDSSDAWVFEEILGLNILYCDEAAAYYAAEQLTAEITATLAGDSLRLSAESSLIPAGRTLASVTWLITDLSGATLLTFGGTPNASAVAANVTGTNLSPVLDLVGAGLTGSYRVQVTVVDSSEASSAAYVIITGTANAILVYDNGQLYQLTDGAGNVLTYAE